MKMASRNIASMHLFLEMKKKFPDLSEDTLRNYVLLYAQDQDKCVSLLQEESKKNHFHSSQPFSDKRLSESKIQSKKSDDSDVNNQGIKSSSATLWQNNSNQIKTRQHNISNKNTSPSTGVLLPAKSNFNTPVKPEVKSAPVISHRDKPFTDMYKNIPVSSHTVVCNMPSEQSTDNRMMFSTTKEHKILPLESTRIKESSTSLPDSCEIESSKRHAVRLSITPSFPFSQQQMNVYGGSVYASTSHSSKPGRHTTSLNLQLQPQSADAYPVEISTIPTNIGSPSNYRDFGSHLQISVGSQGATFTALRLQRPHNPQGQTSPNQLPVTDQTSFNISQSSSQAQNSKAFMFPTHLQVSSPTRGSHRLLDKNYNYVAENNLSKVISDKDHCISNINLDNMKSDERILDKNLNTESNFLHDYQTSPDYILDVKKHQRAKLGLVEEELNKEKSICANLKYEVNLLEQELLQMREKKNTIQYAELVKKMKEENRKLTLECNDLIMEYDLCGKDQLPVGVVDEDFYSNIFTGPNDGLTVSSSSEKSKKKVSQGKDKLKPSSAAEDDDDEKNTWKCKNCTFANHPALQKCEMCELPKHSGSLFDDG